MKGMHANNPGLLLLFLMMVSLSSGMALASNTVSADDSTTVTASIKVPIACTMRGVGTNSHTATLAPNTYSGASGSEYENGIGKTTLTAICNDDNGFAIYAIGYTGNSYDFENHTKLVGNNTNSTINTKAYAAGDTTSNWSMKLIKINDSTISYNPQNLSILSDTEGSFASWHSIPDEYTKVAEYHANTGSSVTDTTLGVVLEATYAAYIAQNQPTDTYVGQVKYTMVHPYSHAKPMNYNTNADDISEITYLQEFAMVGNTNRDSIIASMVPEQQYTVTDSRDGKTYTIAKYLVGIDEGPNENLVYDYVNSCYDDNDNYNYSNCDVIIYAQLPDIWKTYADSFDGSDYTFDESLHPLVYDVWMTQNLDLDLDSSTIYTNEDTDIGYDVSTGEYDYASWTPMRSTYQATSTHAHEWCQGGVWDPEHGFCADNDTPESYDAGNLYWNLTESDSGGDWLWYLSSCDSSASSLICDQSRNPISTYVSTTGSAQYHLGNYYNWAAALATNDSSVFNDTNFVEQSICPAGWTIPRATNNEDSFYALWYQYNLAGDGYEDANENNTHDAGENALWTSPLYFNASGIYVGDLDYVGYMGLYSSPSPNANDAYVGVGFTINETAIPSAFFPRTYGVSVRCVLRPVFDPYSGGGGGMGPK